MPAGTVRMRQDRRVGPGIAAVLAWSLIGLGNAVRYGVYTPLAIALVSAGMLAADRAVVGLRAAARPPARPVRAAARPAWSRSAPPCCRRPSGMPGAAAETWSHGLLIAAAVGLLVLAAAAAAGALAAAGGARAGGAGRGGRHPGHPASDHRRLAHPAGFGAGAAARAQHLRPGRGPARTATCCRTCRVRRCCSRRSTCCCPTSGTACCWRCWWPRCWSAGCAGGPAIAGRCWCCPA